MAMHPSPICEITGPLFPRRIVFTFAESSREPENNATTHYGITWLNEKPGVERFCWLRL
jgi:hypothetical protein